MPCARAFSAQANGVGRNALLSQVLQGRKFHLLTVQTLDESAGHLGLKTTRTEVTDAGDLTLGRESKAEVPANRSVLYAFTVSEPGQYSIRTLGQNRFFPSRLEDGEGWPILGSPARPRISPAAWRLAATAS